MKLSALIAHVGDENVKFQNLAGSLSQVTKSKKDARVSFYTSKSNGDALMREAAGIGTSPLVALVLWLPKDKVDAALAKQNNPLKDAGKAAS